MRCAYNIIHSFTIILLVTIPILIAIFAKEENTFPCTWPVKDGDIGGIFCFSFISKVSLEEIYAPVFLLPWSCRVSPCIGAHLYPQSCRLFKI